MLEAGTLTCRYHGMRFDGRVTGLASLWCNSADFSTEYQLAFLADGPDSPAPGKVRARAFPTEEINGVIWVYLGDETPNSVLQTVPRASDVFGYDHLFIHRVRIDQPPEHPGQRRAIGVPFSDGVA